MNDSRSLHGLRIMETGCYSLMEGTFVNFTRIHRNNISEEIAIRMKESMLAGGMKPGDKLPSAKQLMEQFGVGRSTVREALSALQAMGWIETRQGEGSFIKALPLADSLEHAMGVSSNLDKRKTLELLEARKALEVSNAMIAAERSNDADIQDLQQIVEKMEQHIGDETIGEELDISFHMTLAKATHNTIMVQLLQTISDQMEMAIKETRRLELYGDCDVSKRLLEEHRAILNAVRERNEEQARSCMMAHLIHVENVLRPFLENHK